jgi:hypothetical protein
MLFSVIQYVAVSLLLAPILAVAAASDPAECSAPNASPRKFHPGHYVALSRRDTREDMEAALAPGVVGAQVRYLWKDLEPEEGVYDFSKIREDLAVMEKHDAQLVVLIEDKTFSNELPTPRYLKDFTLASRKGGFTTARWDSFVTARMNALTMALGREFDCRPNFEGVALQESALSLPDNVLAANGYTPEKYKDALETMLLSAAANMPNSQVFWYMNFLPGRQNLIAEVAITVAKAGVAMGGPDILPDNAALAERTYPFYEQFRGKMILFGSMQNDSYAHLHRDIANGKYWTLKELFIFARDRLHVSYIFWNRKTWRKPPDSYVWTDALTVIAAEPSFTH